MVDLRRWSVRNVLQYTINANDVIILFCLIIIVTLLPRYPANCCLLITSMAAGTETLERLGRCVKDLH